MEFINRRPLSYITVKGLIAQIKMLLSAIYSVIKFQTCPPNIFQNPPCFFRWIGENPPSFSVSRINPVHITDQMTETSTFIFTIQRDIDIFVSHKYGFYYGIVTSLTVSHTGFTEHIIIKGNVVIVDSQSFGAMYGGYTGPTKGSEITTKSPSAA